MNPSLETPTHLFSPDTLKYTQNFIYFYTGRKLQDVSKLLQVSILINIPMSRIDSESKYNAKIQNLIVRLQKIPTSIVQVYYHYGVRFIYFECTSEAQLQTQFKFYFR